MNSASENLAILQTASLTSVLEQQLETLIIEGALAPGDRINENKLAARFGTSRGPLREATRALEAKGFVEVIRNRGVFVRQLSVEDVCELYDVRGTLFGLAGRLVSQRVTDELLNKLSDILDKLDAFSDADNFESYYPLNLTFHQIILEASGNKTLVAEYGRLANKMHLFRAKGLVQGGGMSVSNSEHREMFEALKDRDPDRAYVTHWEHVERSKYRVMSAFEKRSHEE
ncbi:MAG: FCD domain-containing protein [Silicimonas sp.]|nr:FCD domain-containing protein [Silicimonas sp.]